MRYCLTNAQMREADKNTIEGGVASEALMTRAGCALADFAAVKAGEKGLKSILVVCGGGNNGGDGYVAARLLKDRGFSVKVFALGDRFSPDCLREKGRYNGDYTDKICGEIILDCIFGTGFKGGAEGAYAQTIDAVNGSGAFVISADIPSGLNGDNGRVETVAIKADATLAISHIKLGLLLGEGLDYSGEICVADIGIKAGCGAELYSAEDVKKFFPARKRNSNKGDFGKACIVAGSPSFSGAAVLSAAGALRGGCGYVYAAVDEKIKYAMLANYPQVIYVGAAALNADCIAFGMGKGATEQTYDELCGILQNYGGKLIIDADGLNCLARYGKGVLKNAVCKVLLTPHIKEFSRLTGLDVQEVCSSPLELAKSFAKEYNVTVALKSAATVITDGERSAINIRGSSALAKAGSGDILSGLIAGNAARGLNLYDAAVCSCYLLGAAAEYCSEKLGDYFATAGDIINFLGFNAL